jgi:hypothetical protein
MPATLKVCPRYANAPACGCTAAQSRPEGFSTALLKGGGGRAALAHNGCFADAPKRFIARELTLPLLDCGMAAAPTVHCSAVVCRSTLCLSASLSRAKTSTRTRRVSSCTARTSGWAHSVHHQGDSQYVAGIYILYSAALPIVPAQCHRIQCPFDAQRCSARPPTAVGLGCSSLRGPLCFASSLAACVLAMQTVLCFGSRAANRPVSADRPIDMRRTARSVGPTCNSLVRV